MPPVSAPIVPAPFPMAFSAMPPVESVPVPYVTGQFFGARPQFTPMMKPAFSPALARPFLPPSTVAMAAAGRSYSLKPIR